VLADAFHRVVGEHCAAAAVRVVAVGELGRGYLIGAAGERWFPGVDECIAALPGLAPAGSAVLVKASRLLRLERVAEALAAGGLASPADGPTAAGSAALEDDDDA
jgi:UDP-N-acetylmuramoyl-tripeptide--D-alanyl-D-alanine ligase